ncbi:MAG: aldo/keto reductase [Polyangiaceae bacterium]
MRKRQLGRTALVVSELTLGTWGLSGDAYGPVNDVDADATIDRAVALGITLFDTADVYGSGATGSMGRMEKKLGQRLPQKTTMVATKIGTSLEGYPEKQFDAQSLFMAFERSQERLRRDAIDVLLLHNPSPATFTSSEAIDLMKRLKDEGKVRAWGVAAGSVEVAKLAIERGCDVLEMAYNCFFTSDVKMLAPSLLESGVALLARSVLAYGLLAGHWTADREFYPPDHRAERWNENELRRRVEQVGALRSALGGPAPTLRSVALRYVLANDRVTSAVLGPRNPTQLDQLVRDAGRMPPYLAPQIMTRLEEALASHGVTGE